MGKNKISRKLISVCEKHYLVVYEFDDIFHFEYRALHGDKFDFALVAEDDHEFFIEMERQYYYFDVERHVNVRIQEKQEGEVGVPSVVALVDSARDIAKMLKDVSDELYRLTRKETNQVNNEY